MKKFRALFTPTDKQFGCFDTVVEAHDVAEAIKKLNELQQTWTISGVFGDPSEVNQQEAAARETEVFERSMQIRYE